MYTEMSKISFTLYHICVQKEVMGLVPRLRSNRLNGKNVSARAGCR